MAIPKKKSIIPDRIKVSFQTNLMPTPLIITDFTIIKNHFAGIKFEINLKGNGIFSIGKIKPLNITVGKNIATKEMNMADCWESVPAEINKPSPKETKINKMLSAYNNTKLPLIGTSKTK